MESIVFYMLMFSYALLVNFINFFAYLQIHMNTAPEG